jgi:hypothetical protein
MKKWVPQKENWFDRFEDEMGVGYERGELFPKIVGVFMAIVFVGMAWIVIVCAFQLD